MLLTPNFTMKQNANFVICTVHAPYTKVQEVDIHIEDYDLSFFAKPYLLKLKLPGKVLDDGSSCKWLADEGDYELKLLKKSKGESFPDLDLLTTLLQCKPDKINVRPGIEVLSDNKSDDEEKAEDCTGKKEELKELSSKYGYGFANQKSDVFPQSMTCDSSVFPLANPEYVPLEERVQKMREADLDKFNWEYYMQVCFV